MSTPFGVSTGRVFSPTVPSARHHDEPVRPYQDDQEQDQHHGELQVLVLRRRGLWSEQGQEGDAEHHDHRYRARYQHRLDDHGAMTSMSTQLRPWLIAYCCGTPSTRSSLTKRHRKPEKPGRRSSEGDKVAPPGFRMN